MRCNAVRDAVVGAQGSKMFISCPCHSWDVVRSTHCMNRLHCRSLSHSMDTSIDLECFHPSVLLSGWHSKKEVSLLVSLLLVFLGPMQRFVLLLFG